MTQAAEKNLSKTGLHRLLAAVGSQPTETEKVSAEKFDFHRPHCFSPGQMQNLKALAEKLARAICEKFNRFYNSTFEVTIASIELYYAGPFFAGNQPLVSGSMVSKVEPVEPQNPNSPFCLAFSSDQHTCGTVTIPKQSATKFLQLILGESESAKNPADNNLSHLELSILTDIASIFVNALALSHKSLSFLPADKINSDQIPLHLNPTDAVCSITIDIKKAQAQDTSQVFLILDCSRLDSAVGKEIHAAKKTSADDITKAVTEHLQYITVPLTAELGCANLTLEQAMSLGKNDVLILNKKTSEDAWLLLEGKKIFKGRVAKLQGCKAILITAPAAASNLNKKP